jgi:3-oxoacyl-[acyl-carrier protein] reductase
VVTDVETIWPYRCPGEYCRRELLPSASRNLPWREWKEVIDVNLKGTFLMCREVAPVMQKQKSGRILNTASNYGVTGSALRTPYSAAKAGIIAFTKTLAQELAPDGILVNTVAPGPTDTARVMGKESAEARKQRWSQIPLVEPEAGGHCRSFYFSPRRKVLDYGQTFHVNGGLVTP